MRTTKRERKMESKLEMSNVGEYLHVYVIDTKNKVVGDDSMCNDLGTYYKRIGCTCVDICTIEVEGRKFWLVSDHGATTEQFT